MKLIFNASILVCVLSMLNALASYFDGNNNACGAWICSMCGWAMCFMNERKK